MKIIKESVILEQTTCTEIKSTGSGGLKQEVVDLNL